MTMTTKRLLRRRKRRQRRRKTRMDRIEAADRGKQQHQQQQQQQQRQSREDEKSSKEWENNNDSWKTIPRDDKNWHSYRNAMDIWDTSNSENERSESVAVTKYSNGVRGRRGQNEMSKDSSRTSKDYGNGQRGASSDRENSTRDKRSKKSENRKNDYDSGIRGGVRSDNERSARYANGDDQPRRKGDDERREKSKQRRNIDESEDDEMMTRNDDIDDDDDNYGVEYKNDYDTKKYYETSNDNESHRYAQQNENGPRENTDKYGDDNKSESETTSTDSEDASTITIPETGRKVEHIAQKLEQTAQKYAREHSPPKYAERRRPNANETAYKQDNNNHNHHHHNNNGHHNQQESKVNLERDDKPPPSYERAYENEARSRNSRSYDRGYQSPSDNISNSNKQQSRPNNTGASGQMGNSANGTYERTSFAKNPERKRNSMDRDGSSHRRYDNRPRPPFEDAPERPEPRNSAIARTGNASGYRERRYSDKEEIYGETGGYARESSTFDKDRGYESNFETKLERSKILEKVQLTGHRGHNDDSPRNRSSGAIDEANRSARNNEINDTNNNTLKNDRKNMLLPRQATTLGHMAQTGRTFDIETKSPKLVKRTKSFWRFRRDSDVLEGMALWQHRSLVDIPKMLKRESSDDDRNKNDTISTMGRKTASPEGSQGSGKSIGKESRSSDNTITNDEDKRSNPRNREHERYQNEREERSEEPKPAERIHVPDKSEYYDTDFPTPAERPKLTERSDYRMMRDDRPLFVGNVSRKAILEKERKRSLEAKRNMVVAELKENNEAAASKIDNNRRNKSYGDDEDGLIQGFSETEASDEESTYSCIIVKDQAVAEKTLLPRTKLRRDSDREREKNTCGPWYDLWGVDNSVAKKKNK